MGNKPMGYIVWRDSVTDQRKQHPIHMKFWKGEGNFPSPFECRCWLATLGYRHIVNAYFQMY